MLRSSLRSVFVGLLLLSVAPASEAQPEETAPAARTERLALRGPDWVSAAKAAPGIQVDDALRLRPGTPTAQITSPPIELPFSVNGIGPHWDASTPTGTALHLELRTRTGDEAPWGPWVPASHEVVVPKRSEDGRTNNAYAGDISGGLVLTDAKTNAVQVRVTLHGTDRAGPVLRRLSLYLVDATDGPSVPAEPQKQRRPRPKAPDTTKPRTYTRDEWGARPPRSDYRYAPATHLALHHTATAGAGAADSWEECAAAVRAIQDYHMNTRGWIDIGYNYLVCQTGALFQGREDDNDRRDVVAAHDGYNEGSVGTAGLGFFHPPENQRPADALIDRFVDLFAWIAAQRDIDPEGTARYAGYGAPLRTVYGHRDVTETACPGDHFYPRRSAIVDRLATLVRPPSSQPIVAPNAPNPAASVTHFDLELDQTAPVRLTVHDLLGRRVATRRYGFMPPGTHTVSIRTARWASGTYPYRLSIGDTSATGTIQVVR